MKPSQISTSIRSSLRTGRPLMIWGKPGVGKSKLVAAEAAALGYDVLDWRLCLMDSVDLRGVPNVTDGRTRWNPPAELPDPISAKNKRKPLVIFFDEYMQGEISTVNASSQLVLDRRLGSYVLPDDVRIIAASNRIEDRATVQRMPTHIAGRFDHVTMDVDAPEWVLWAKASGQIDPRVIAFIKYRPQLLHTFDPTSKEIPFASNRSWEFLSDKLKDLDSSGELAKMEVEHRVENFSGNVGKAPGSEFAGFLGILHQLIDIESILLSPDKAGVPSDPSVLYALVYALLDRADGKHFPAIVKYIERMPQDFAYLFMDEVRKNDRTKPLQKTKEFISWAVKHQDFI